MLRKKNYKEEDHFTQYYSVYLPRNHGHKLTFYYKRYRPAAQPTQLYDLLHPSPSSHSQSSPSPFPVDRTLELISFDGPLDPIRPFLRRVGRIRRFQSGQTQYRGRQCFYCLGVFKYQFDLVKCFRQGYLQQIINRESSHQHVNQQARQTYQAQLISQYMGKELQGLGKLQELSKEGYNVITNKLGEYRHDYAANQKAVEELPQVKKKKKMEEKRRRKIEERVQESVQK